jgi:hypothetical protein
MPDRGNDLLIQTSRRRQYYNANLCLASFITSWPVTVTD